MLRVMRATWSGLSCRAAVPGSGWGRPVHGARKAKGPARVPRRLLLHRKRGEPVCRRWWRNRGKRSQDRRRTDKDTTKPQNAWAGCSRAAPWHRGPSSSSRQSSATFIEVSVGSRVAGPDQYVGVLLDQGQLRFAGHGRLRLSGVVLPKQVSKRRNARQFAESPGQGKRCSALSVLCAFAYWQGPRDRQFGVHAKSCRRHRPSA